MLNLYEFKFRAMGSPCSIALYCADQSSFEEAKLVCIAEVNRLESKYSRYIQDSLLSQINQAAGSQKSFLLDDETYSLLKYAEIAFEVSDGLFDVTSGVLRKVWDFSLNKLPDLELLSKSLVDLVGFNKLDLSSKQFRLPIEGMQIDFGGIVKEYAADLLVIKLQEKNICHGIVDLGGDIAIVGPHPDQTPWNIAISDPRSPNKAIAHIFLSSGGLASSGDYERYIVLNGEKHSHLLNPKTGWPVKGLAGVSVCSEKCVMAGTIATTALLMGTDEGLKWLDEVGCEYIGINQHFQVHQNKASN